MSASCRITKERCFECKNGAAPIAIMAVGAFYRWWKRGWKYGRVEVRTGCMPRCIKESHLPVSKFKVTFFRKRFDRHSWCILCMFDLLIHQMPEDERNLVINPIQGFIQSGYAKPGINQQSPLIADQQIHTGIR